MKESHGPVLVQFPHPGREHNPGKSTRQPWNTRDHGRKFLQSQGRYVTVDGHSSAEVPLVFCGEWEAPSYVIECWPKQGDLPRFLHEPVWERPRTREFRQNTDPWVFGDCFRYSNCKQLSQRGLRNLAPGSLLLFGSTIHSQFVIDTVFVVSERSTIFSPANRPKTDDVFRICTIDALSSGGPAGCGARYCAAEAHANFTLYEGATFENPVDGMYSFSPCRRADDKEMRFARPILTLDRVNPSSKQSPKGAKDELSLQEISNYWAMVCKQVVAAGCQLGVHFATPREDV